MYNFFAELSQRAHAALTQKGAGGYRVCLGKRARYAFMLTKPHDLQANLIPLLSKLNLTPRPLSNLLLSKLNLIPLLSKLDLLPLLIKLNLTPLLSKLNLIPRPLSKLNLYTALAFPLDARTGRLLTTLIL